MLVTIPIIIGNKNKQKNMIYDNFVLYSRGELCGKVCSHNWIPHLEEEYQLSESGRVNLEEVAIGNELIDLVIQVGTHALNAYFSSLDNEIQ